MKFAIWLLVTLLIPLALTVSAVFVLNQTLLNSRFLKNQLLKTTIYQDIADFVPEQILKGQEMKARERNEAAAKLKSTLTPSYLQQQIEQIIDQAGNLAHGKSKELTIDLSDGISRLQAAGLPIKNDTIKPIHFSVDQKPELNKGVKIFGTSQLVSYGLFGLFVILLIGLGIMTRSFTGLVTVLFWVAVVNAGIYIAIGWLPDLILSKLPQDNLYLNHFMKDIEQLLTGISGSISNLTGIIALSSIAGAILLLIVQHFAFKKGENHS